MFSHKYFSLNNKVCWTSAYLASEFCFSFFIDATYITIITSTSHYDSIRLPIDGRTVQQGIHNVSRNCIFSLETRFFPSCLHLPENLLLITDLVINNLVSQAPDKLGNPTFAENSFAPKKGHFRATVR